MNKKILLSTLLAGSVVATSLFIPKSLANSEGLGTKLMGSVNKDTISIVLPSKNERNSNSNSLTKSDLVKLLEEKYNSGVVKSVKDANGNKISNDDDKVGTGSVVTLEEGNKITVVLYGDVNGDGIVNTNDTLAIANHNVGSNTLSGVYFTAGELTGNQIDNLLDANDTLRVAYYNVNKVGQGESYGMSIVDKALYPEEVVVPDEVIKEAIEAFENNDLCEFEFNNETNEVTCKFSSQDQKISDFVGKGTGFIAKFIEQLKNPNVKDVVVSFNGKTVSLDSNSTSKDILKAAEDLLGNLDVSIIDLLDSELKLEINFKNSDLVTEGNLNNNSVNYVLKFKADVVNDEKFLNDVIDELNIGNKEVFNSELDNEKKEVKFTILKDEKLSNFSSLIGTLVDTLKNTDGLDSIVVDNLPILKNYKVTKETDVKSLETLLEGFESSTLKDLCGRELPVKIYVSEGFNFLNNNEDDIKTDEAGKKYVEYKFSFVDGTKAQ